MINAIVSAILGYIKRKNEQTIVKNQVKLSPILLIVGMVGVCLFGTVLIIQIFATPSITGIIITLLLTLLSLSMILGYYNCRITFDQSGFIHKNFIGIKRRYEYFQVTGISEQNDTIVFIGKKKIRIDNLACGTRQFLKAVKQNRPLDHNGNRSIVPQVKSKLFNGNISNPGEMIFAYILMGFVCVAWILFATLFPLPNKSNSYSYTLTYQNNIIQKNDLIIYVEESSTPFFICDYKKVMPDYEEFLTGQPIGKKLKF